MQGETKIKEGEFAGTRENKIRIQKLQQRLVKNENINCLFCKRRKNLKRKMNSQKI